MYSVEEVVVQTGNKQKEKLNNNNNCGGHPQEENRVSSSSGIALNVEIWDFASYPVSLLFVGSDQKQLSSQVILVFNTSNETHQVVSFHQILFVNVRLNIFTSYFILSESIKTSRIHSSSTVRDRK